MQLLKHLKQSGILLATFISIYLTGFGISSKAKVLNQLEKIYSDDQKIRQLNNPSQSELKDLAFFDKLNLLKVEGIFKKYDWPQFLSREDEFHKALFFVIQHSNTKIQKKYLPLLRHAGKEGKLKPSSIALLEDRIAISEGRPQIYGTQVGKNADTGEYFVHPLIEPSLVDERRKMIGLNCINEYLKNWNLSI